MVCSLFTIVPFSVSAYANIDGYPDFDVDVYVAGLMTDSDNPLYRTIENQISLDSPNDVVIKQLKEDTGFQASYTAWQIATFKGGDTVSDPLTEVGYYQSLILNTISEALTSSNVKNAFDNTVIKDAKHLQSTFTNILKLEFVFTDLNDLNVAEMSQDEQIKVMDAFSSSFKKTYPAVSDVGKFVSVFSTIVKEGKALETAINNLVAYTESVGMNDYMKAVVSDLYKNCDSGNVAMKSALFEIDKACQSYELAYSAATFDAVTSSLSVVCEKVVNTMVDGIMAANPAGLSIMIGQAIGKGVANFLFSTDAICEQYHKMCCLYEFEELLGKVTKLEIDSFTKSKTNYNANKIFSVVGFLYKEYDVSCDLAKKYADIIFKESIAGVFVLNGDGYNKYISSVESLRSIAESNYDFLKGDAWMCFLEEDYPDIYNALIKEDEEIENPYIPVTKIAFEKESVEWGTQDTFLNNDKATITPSNASSKGIEYTSSDPSVVSYNKFGAVVHKAGTATVTATSVSSGLTATLNVTVVDGKGADGIALEDPNPGTTANGKCGDNVNWRLYSDGTLYISGTGNMSKYSRNYGSPWKKYGIKSVILGYGVTSIGDYAFYKCTSLKGVTIPNSVTFIGNLAFSGCESLTSATIPNSVTGFSGSVFKDCTTLESVTIGNSVTRIGEDDFIGCTSLASIKVDNQNQNYCSVGGVLFNKDKTYLIKCPAGITSKTYSIPDSVTRIGNDAFKSCKNLISLTIPDSVIIIDSHAFEVCTNLESVTIPNSVTYLGYDAFSGCTSLTNVTIGNSVKSIGEDAFSYCKNLKSITIPNSVTSIGDGAFSYCTSLTSVTIPDSVTNIGISAFKYCTSLTGVTIPDSVTSIGVYVFCNCTSLTKITIPDSVTSIGGSTFDGCTNLTSVTIPDSVTSIGGYAFYNCTSLTSITIPDSVTSIGYKAFYNCTSLTSITIPDGVTSLGESAFDGCTSLESVTIGNSVTNIGSEAFCCCTSLANIKVDNQNQNYCSVGGVLFNKDKTYLIKCPAGITSKTYSIPDSVTNIGSEAFYYCTSLESVKIGNSVKSIGSNAFYCCTSLTNVTIGNSVKSIGEFAFSHCKNLKSITIPDSVTSIASYAFEGCISLKSVTIPNSVTSIGGYAFFNCSNLKDVYYSGNEEEWNKISIGSYNSYLENATIHFNSEGPLPAETIVDENTGISVTTNSVAEINVENLTDSDSTKNVISILDKSEKLADLYDISLTKDGVAIQPDEPATVKIPTNNENAKVYRIEDDGTATDMNAIHDNGYMVFTTDHFNLYALVVPNENVIGDVNGDGVISVADAVVLQKYIIKSESLSDEQLAVADTNGDGDVNIKDVTQIQKYLAEYISSLG